MVFFFFFFLDTSLSKPRKKSLFRFLQIYSKRKLAQNIKTPPKIDTKRQGIAPRIYSNPSVSCRLSVSLSVSLHVSSVSSVSLSSVSSSPSPLSLSPLSLRPRLAPLFLRPRLRPSVPGSLSLPSVNNNSNTSALDEARNNN